MRRNGALLRLRGAFPVTLTWSLLALFSTLLSSCTPDPRTTLERIQATKLLRVGTDATYPPFETIDPKSGQLVGFDIDLLRALGRSLGAETEFIVVPFDGIIAGLKGGKYDAIASALTITPERAAEVLFTAPYAAAGQSIAVRANDGSITDFEGLVRRKIGVQLGTTGELEAEKAIGAQVVSFDAIGNAFRDLENRNVDAVIADTPTARLFQREHGSIRIVGAPLTNEEYGIALRSSDATLKAAFDRELAAMQQSGELSKLLEKWGFEPTP